MTKDEFIRRRQPAWKELEGLLSRIEPTGLRSLKGPELLRLGALYRRLTGDLAYARGRFADENLIGYLNRLAQKGYSHVYSPDKAKGGLLHFLAVSFPSTMRRRWKLVIFSCALMYLPALFAFAYVYEQPSNAEIFMGGTFVDMASDRMSQGVAAPEITDQEMGAVSANVMTNNIRVSILAFGGGALIGVLTVTVLFQNGLMLGSFAALFHSSGDGFLLWTSILPHGVCELSAICIAGAAGLRLAGGIVFPGRRTRRRSIPEAAGEAAVLFGGSVLLLIIAGIIEGFLSFTDAPANVKWAITGATTLFCVFYLILLPLKFSGATESPARA